MIDDSDPCFGPCHACGKNWETSHYFSPLNAHTCHECRKANRHRMTIGDAWEELMVKWNEIQPHWVHQTHCFFYELFTFGPVKMYRRRKAMERFYSSLYKDK